jgi:hypothetical protein
MPDIQATWIALIAIILGPTISLIIARNQNKTQLKAAERQFAAAVLSQARLSWIEALRKEVSRLISLLRGLSREDDWQPVVQSACMIELLLNPQEEIHQDLLNAVYDVILFSAEHSRENTTDHAAKSSESIKQLLKVTQPVLRKEWVRVKRGE